MILEYFGFTFGALTLEFVTNPVRGAASLVGGVLAFFVCTWTCWRMGRFFNLAHRPGIGTLVLALGAGLTAFLAVVSLSAVGYARAMASNIFTVTQFTSESVILGASTACRLVTATLPLVHEQVQSGLTLNCESPLALDDFRTQLGPRLEAFHGWLQDRLRLNQFITIVAALLSLITLFTFAGWRPYRTLRVYTTPGQFSSRSAR